MPCTHVKLADGTAAIVCGGGRRRDKCSACGKPADLLCDWKVSGRRSGTCDKPICRSCTHRPARGKDLCPKHAAEWQKRCESPVKGGRTESHGRDSPSFAMGTMPMGVAPPLAPQQPTGQETR